MAASPEPTRSTPTPFELLITCNPPILESLLAQVPTETIFRLYQTSSFLRDFFSKSPTSWRYISWRLYQPAVTATPVAVAAGSSSVPRQSSNYALDQILLNIINPFSTRLVSLELDNTAVSGATLTSTVLILRRDTLLHVSVRGCKNVSLKYHINPWLQMHALARESSAARGPLGFETLALKSLYTYRCRHHRRRPYLPSSLARKESDSEPTHELVLTCHKLGIWTDTAWCTTPGARCYRRRGYVKMRMPQDPREVWVVYDRLWRSRNWLGPIDQSKASNNAPARKRKRDCRSWEFDEEAINGEVIGTEPEGKATPAHLRDSHRKFVDNIICQNCSAEILERCEQCSVMMHCSGCRKTLCASCAFDRPYLRNKNAPEEERNKFWWAPGCAVSPCSMQDQDLPHNGGVNGAMINMLPNIKFKWCCTEPVFSGGGGITFTFGPGSTRDTDRVRAVPLPPGHGWEDPEFDLLRPHPESVDAAILGDSSQSQTKEGPGGRWSSIDGLFQALAAFNCGGHSAVPVPRVLCDECYNSEQWKVKCKSCSTALCLKHDIGDRSRARICGYKDLAVEKQEYKSRQKAIKLLTTLMRQRKEMSSQKHSKGEPGVAGSAGTLEATTSHPSSSASPQAQFIASSQSGDSEAAARQAISFNAEMGQLLRTLRSPLAEMDLPHRPLSPASNSTGPLSRSTSPSPSVQSMPPNAESSAAPHRGDAPDIPAAPKWQGCQAFFCPTVRTAGDHRRRCTAVIRQCMECKIHVCGDCVNALDPPCPCKGCRGPHVEGLGNTATLTITAASSTLATESAPFFCPNCRWHRMLTGKCKRKSELFLRAQSASQKLKNRRRRKEKMRKPVEERRAESTTHGSMSTTEEAIDGLVDFFTSLNTQYPGAGQPHHTNPPVESDSGPTTQTGPGQHHDIQELEDMGALARDLIRRIQRLREQFRPGSLAALALPDIRVDDEDGTPRLVTTYVQEAGPMHETQGTDVDGLNMQEPADMDEDDEQLDGRDSSTD